MKSCFLKKHSVKCIESNVDLLKVVFPNFEALLIQDVYM